MKLMKLAILYVSKQEKSYLPLYGKYQSHNLVNEK